MSVRRYGSMPKTLREAKKIEKRALKTRKAAARRAPEEPGPEVIAPKAPLPIQVPMRRGQ